MNKVSFGHEDVEPKEKTRGCAASSLRRLSYD